MQKEKLSALMDGETLDNELLNELERSSEMQKTWESYHLIRDTLRGDTSEVLHFDISARVMAAIENEPVASDAFLAKSTPVGQLAYPDGRCRVRIPCCDCWRSAV